MSVEINISHYEREQLEINRKLNVRFAATGTDNRYYIMEEAYAELDQLLGELLHKLSEVFDSGNTDR